MGRSQESSHKKSVRNKKEKKRKEKEQKRQARKEQQKGNNLDDMIAYVDEEGNITDTPPDPEQKDEVELDDIEISVPKSENRQRLNPERTGVLKFFNDNKGFGFIKDDELRDDVFVHINSFLDDIDEGNRVTYEIEMGKKGYVAKDVKRYK